MVFISFVIRHGGLLHVILLSSYRATETGEKREPNSETRKNPEKKVQPCTVFCVIIAWTTRVLFNRPELTSRINHLQLQLGRQIILLRRISYSIKKWSFGVKNAVGFYDDQLCAPSSHHQILCRQNNIDQYLQQFVNAAQFVCTLNNFPPFFFSKQMYPIAFSLFINTPPSIWRHGYVVLPTPFLIKFTCILSSPKIQEWL